MSKMNDTKFKINKINLLGSWCHNLKNNTDCTICRTNLNLNSIYINEKDSVSIIETGVCGHSFHKECITPWIKTNQYCPICSSKWSIVK
jgi:RING-box protein 1